MAARRLASPIRSVTLLANDPGARAGVSLFHRGAALDVRGIDPWGKEPTSIAALAALYAERDETELMLVGEDWGVGNFATPQMLVGLAQTWGIVKREMLLAGTHKSRIWRIPTGTWRAFHGAPSGQKYFDWKKWAIDVASSLAGKPITNDNAAESYLIGYAALRLPETLDLVPQRVRKRHGEMTIAFEGMAA